MPRTSDATINDFSFTQWAVLVLADVRDCGNFTIVFENRDPFAAQAHNARTLFRDVLDGANINETVFGSRRGNEVVRLVIRHLTFCSRASTVRLLASEATAKFAIQRGFFQSGSHMQTKHQQETYAYRRHVNGT